MKKFFKVIILMVLLTIVFLVISGNGVIYKKTDDLTVISPYSKSISKIARLYYINQDVLISESRMVVIQNLDTEYSIVSELKKGSKIEAYDSPIHEEVEIISVKTTDRVCYVNLSEEFLIPNDERLYLNAMSIVNTLTDLESIDFVQLLIDGKKVSSGSVDLTSQLSKNTNVIQAKELNYKDTVKKFLHFISLGRYDLAYDMIDSESKKMVGFDDFKESMILVRDDLQGYSQRYFFARREKDKYILQVKYIRRETVVSEEGELYADRPLETTYIWAVIKEDGVWKILYYNY